MAKRRDDAHAGLDRVLALADEAVNGLHQVEPASAELPSGLPEPLIELYARCDGARLFLDTIEIVRAADVAHEGEPEQRWQFATVDGDPIWLDARGRIWRLDHSVDRPLCEGSRLDRWLAGAFDATALLYDGDGEFADGVFDEDGEIETAVAERALRAQLRRDPTAPAPRWRLARLLLAAGANADARAQLEEVVAHAPDMAWAWLDLARISEQAGDLANAVEEARAAASVDDDGYFWAQVARLGARAGDEPARAEAAARAAELAPSLKSQQLEGAREQLAAGDADGARGLIELLRAVWPRDLDVLALARQLEAGEN